MGLAWAIFGAPVCAGFIAAMVGLVSKLSGHTFLGAFLPVLCVLAPLASIFCFYAFGEDAGAKYHMKKMVEKERGTLCEWEIVEEDHWEAFVEKLQSG